MRVVNDTRTYAVQQINVTVSKSAGAITAGSFGLSYNSATVFECLPHDAPAWRVERALEALSSIDDVTVTSRVDSTSATDSFLWFVTFDGPNVNGDVPPISVVNTFTAPCATIVAIDGTPAVTLGASVVVPGVAGAASEIETVSSVGGTTAIDTGSSFALSFSFRGELDNSACGTCGTVYAGTNVLDGFDAVPVTWRRAVDQRRAVHRAPDAPDEWLRGPAVLAPSAGHG